MPVDKINPTAYKEMEFHIKTFVSELWKLTIIRIHIHVLTHSFSIYTGIVPVFKFRFDFGVLFFMSTTYDQKH